MWVILYLLSISAVAYAVPSITLLARVPQSTLAVDVRCSYANYAGDLGDFAAPMEKIQIGNNTPTICVAECSTRGYALAGLEHGDTCICGNTYIDDIQPIRAGSWNCQYPCNGDYSQLCGGYLYRTIYRTSLYQSSSSSSLPATPTSSPSAPQESLTVDVACGIEDGRGAGSFDYYPSYFVGFLLDNTPTTCVNTCDSQGFPLAAVEFGYMCFCGYVYMNDVAPASAPASECNRMCEDDSTQTCGGNGRVTVYRTSWYK